MCDIADSVVYVFLAHQIGISVVSHIPVPAHGKEALQRHCNFFHFFHFKMTGTSCTGQSPSKGTIVPITHNYYYDIK